VGVRELTVEYRGGSGRSSYAVEMVAGWEDKGMRMEMPRRDMGDEGGM
jgi:hypothetical protein